MIDESIFKAYDIRGIYPDSLCEDVARKIGRAYVDYLGLSGSRVVVGRDMRLSGEPLEGAFIKGVTEAGADVLDIGLVSTDALYFAVGYLEEPGGAMVTASHNPKEYNGLKLCREDAIALSGDHGLRQIRDLISSGELPEASEYAGSVEEADITAEYANHCLSFINTGGLRPLKIVVDAGNGMAGKMLPPIFEGLPFEYVPMYFVLEGVAGVGAARGRSAHPHQGGALDHQTPDALERRRFRRGALRALLLPGQLLRRLGDNRHAHRRRARRSPGKPYLRAPRSHRPLRPLRRDQLRSRGSGSSVREGRRALREARRRGDRPPRWPHRRLRGLVVQPQALEHRAPPPIERRSQRPRHHGAGT